MLGSDSALFAGPAGVGWLLFVHEANDRVAVVESESRGWQLNLDMSGHRLADFPHAALHKGVLAEAPFSPSPGLWMLEIQIRHPVRPFSAFYEDLLLDPSDA